MKCLFVLLAFFAVISPIVCDFAAVCNFDGLGDAVVDGEIKIYTYLDTFKSTITTTLLDLGKSGNYTISIREWGDMSDESGSTAGDLYLVDNIVQLNEEFTIPRSHSGGPIEINVDRLLPLAYEDSIIGRSLLIEEKKDGNKMAQCVIGIKKRTSNSAFAVPASSEVGTCQFWNETVNPENWVIVSFTNPQNGSFSIIQVENLPNPENYTYEIRQFGDIAEVGDEGEIIFSVDETFHVVEATKLAQLIGHSLRVSNNESEIIGECVIGRKPGIICNLVCKNEGTCILNGTTPVCQCKPGFKGDLCEVTPPTTGSLTSGPVTSGPVTSGPLTTAPLTTGNVSDTNTETKDTNTDTKDTNTDTKDQNTELTTGVTGTQETEDTGTTGSVANNHESSSFLTTQKSPTSFFLTWVIVFFVAIAAAFVILRFKSQLLGIVDNVKRRILNRGHSSNSGDATQMRSLTSNAAPTSGNSNNTKNKPQAVPANFQWSDDDWDEESAK